MLAISVQLSRVTELLSYDPDTGIFHWKQKKGRAKPGDVAGTKNSSGYICIEIDSKKLLAHRLAALIMNLPGDGWQVDHINGVRNDNRICNLRIVSEGDNKKNLSLNSRNTSGTSGVSLRKRSGKWHAYINVNGKPINLGEHATKELAVSARKEAERNFDYHINHGRTLA